MSWSNTYTHTLAVAVDILTASVIWNSYDVTVSSRCGIALRVKQGKFLMALGTLLNWLNPGHCEAAILADMRRATVAISFLRVIG